MDKIHLAKELKKLLDEHFPGSFNYTQSLADAIGVHPKTVLKKLRGATPFTFDEVYKIATHFDLPVDTVFNKRMENSKHPMEFYFHDFSTPSDYQQVVKLTMETFALASSSVNSKYMVSSNSLPNQFFAGHEWITKFFYLKWIYFNNGKT